MRLLLVEDDLMIGRAVRRGLEQARFVADWVTDGRLAQAAIANEVYDCVILDIGLHTSMVSACRTNCALPRTESRS